MKRKKRIKIYKQIKKSLETDFNDEGKWEYLGFCEWLMCNYKGSSYQSISHFPELYILEPDDKKRFWFPPRETAPRKEVIKRAIRLAKSKAVHLESKEQYLIPPKTTIAVSFTGPMELPGDLKENSILVGWDTDTQIAIYKVTQDHQKMLDKYMHDFEFTCTREVDHPIQGIEVTKRTYVPNISSLEQRIKDDPILPEHKKTELIYVIQQFYKDENKVKEI